MKINQKTKLMFKDLKVGDVFSWDGYRYLIIKDKEPFNCFNLDDNSLGNFLDEDTFDYFYPEAELILGEPK